jgi:hypothetical protein
MPLLRSCWLVAVLSIASAAAVTTPALAQDEPSAQEMAAARQLFRSGLGHARASRWEQARADFERSYETAPVPTTLLNLAGAQVETGRLVQGAESYRRFLAGATEGRAARYRDQAQSALGAVEARLAHITVEVEGAAANDDVRLDDDPLPHGSIGRSLAADPGEHVVSVVRSGGTIAEERFTLREGQERRVALEVPAVAIPSVAEASSSGAGTDQSLSVFGRGEDERDGEGGGVLASPWFWTAVGAVVIGAAVVVILVATADGGQEDPFQGNLGMGHVMFE